MVTSTVELLNRNCLAGSNIQIKFVCPLVVFLILRDFLERLGTHQVDLHTRDFLCVLYFGADQAEEKHS